MKTTRESTGLEIAIIGMEGKFPGATNVDAYWNNLVNGIESIRFFDRDEMLADGADATLIDNEKYVNAGGVLDDIDCFDAGFFNILPRDAALMDPQHRLFLQVVSHALEKAGYDEQLKNERVSIYAGMASNEYLKLLKNSPELIKDIDEFELEIRNSKGSLPTFVSYKLNLNGPSVHVETACSTSLVAVHMACQSLLSGECDVAVAGGVAVQMNQKKGYLYREGMIRSADGHCRAFDADATGMILGHGLGAVVLKRLEDAIADNDSIDAVILGSAINNDGDQKMGFTAPSVEGQSAVITQAMSVANIDPQTVSYIETHGTGTNLGDPIEISALTQAFSNGGQQAKQYCAIGSVKTNIGHLDIAAGISGLIKAVLALKNKQIPPSLNYTKPNRNIPFNETPFYVNTSLQDWKPSCNICRAGVSSFGIGGTNAHVLLEEAPKIEDDQEAFLKKEQLICLSAKTEQALREKSALLQGFIENNPQESLSHISYTLQTRRKDYPIRYGFCCTSRNEAISLLNKVSVSTASQKELPVYFMFPGQGSQYFNMGQELYELNSLFREWMDRCFNILKSLGKVDYKSILYSQEESRSSEDIKSTGIVQPLLFAIEYSLAKLLISTGVEPTKMIGHSLGEYVAACLAGVFSLEDALHIVFKRGQLMQQLPAGSMLAVFKSAEQLKKILPSGLDIAGINQDEVTVVSGPNDVIKDFEQTLSKQEIKSRHLHTSHAFHSRMMNPMLEKFRAILEKITLNQPTLPFISNVTGQLIKGAEATDPNYWCSHIRQTVLFKEGLSVFLNEGLGIYIEVGPGSTLINLLSQHKLKAKDDVIFSVLPDFRQKSSDQRVFLTALLNLWQVGKQIDFSRFYISQQKRLVQLPVYPFAKNRYWVDGRIEKEANSNSDEEEKTGNQENNISAASEDKSIKGQLKEIWIEILGLDEIDDSADFFELGGHSLLAMQLSQRINERFKIQVSLFQFFKTSTIESLANYLEELSKDNKHQSREWPVAIENSADRYQTFPLTDVQQAYWLGRQDIYDLGKVSTHFYTEMDYKDINTKRLEEALNKLIARHDMLRVVFTDSAEQYVLKEVSYYSIKIQDLSTLSRQDRERALAHWRVELSHQVFDASKFPLFDIRVSILPKGFRLHLSLDSLIFDGSSFDLFFKEWEKLYKNQEKELAPLSLTFRDYVQAYQKLLTSDYFEEDKNYWVNRIEELPVGPELPLRRQPAEVKETRFNRQMKEIDAAIWGQFKEKAKKYQLSPTTALLSIYGMVLNKWSKHPHFSINLTLFNRLPMHAEVNQIIGDFTSLELLEYGSKEQISNNFLTSTKALQDLLSSDLDHRLFTGIDVQREIATRLGRSASTIAPVIFTSLLNIDNTLEDSFLSDQFIDIAYTITQTPQVWLDNKAYERHGNFVAEWDFVEALFHPDMIEQMHQAYCDLIEYFAKQESWDIDKPDIFSSETQAIIGKVNSDVLTVPACGLHDLFYQSAEKHPKKTAIKTDSHALTYDELYQFSNQITHALISAGAKKNTLVAILMEKGWEQVVASLGIMGAGAAYLPISADWPIERIQKVLNQGEVSIVLTQSKVRERLLKEGFSLQKQFECYDVDCVDLWKQYSKNRADIKISPNDIAYVIFTSGSTGQPKGVVISHKGAVNTIVDINDRFSITEKDAAFALSNLSFDLSVYDIFGLLAAGGKIVLPNADQVKEPEQWVNFLIDEKITVWNTVPMFMQMLVDYIDVLPESKKTQLRSTLKWVLLSGDWIPLSLPEKICYIFPEAQVISLGGATEGSIWSILHPIKRVEPYWKSIPYGKAMRNQAMYVLKEDLSLAPFYVSGEIYIGGDGVALGYWKDKEKTQTSFIQHPKTREMLYKTGDLGRLMPDGNIEFLGREDSQVKVGGYRIELGDIENTLVKLPGIKETVVDVVGEKFEKKKLIAYLVRQSFEENQFSLSEKIDFKKAGHNIRKNGLSDQIVNLERKLTQSIDLKHRFARKSYRRFNSKKISKEQILNVLKGSFWEDYTSSSQHLFANLEDILGRLSGHENSQLLLPKYHYPSAGSLYPIQTYISVGKDLPSLKAGVYYYHPLRHQLIRLPEVNTTFLKEDKLSVHFISKLKAIEPLYGENAKRFSELEVGYILNLLEPILKQNGCSVSSKPLSQAFLNALEIDQKDLSLLSISLEPKKTFSNPLKELPSVYVYIKPKRVDGIEKGGLYEYREDVLTFVADWHPAHGSFTQPAQNGCILSEAAFVVLLSGEPTADNYIGAGYLSQSLMEASIDEKLGSCALGYLLNDQVIENQLNGRLLHTVAVGPVTDQQIEAVEYSEANFDVHPDVGFPTFIALQLSQLLPDYMIPEAFCDLETLPLTANGKVDRKRLLKIYQQQAQNSVPVASSSPRNSIELKLHALWCELLNQDQIDIHQDFFKLGGNSLTATRLVAKLNEQLNVKNSIAWVFLNTTIAKQAQSLKENVHGAPYQPLLLLNEGDKKKVPLIFVHPGLAGAESYTAMARLLTKDQPFYVFDSHNLNSKQPMKSTIKELAAYYVSELKKRLPHGPYYMGGFCMGGVIAYEMTQQLIQQGEIVKYVFLLDSLQTKERLKAMREKAPYSFDALLEGLPSRILDYVTSISKEEQQHWAKAVNMDVELLTGYHAQNLEVPVLFFKSTQEYPEDATNSWDKAAKRLSVINVDTDHFGIMDSPYIQEVVDAVLLKLEEEQ